MTKFYVDNQGKYLGGFDGALPPEGSIEVDNPPPDGRHVWNGVEWRQDGVASVILAIFQIEQSITPRRLREAVLGIDDGWLAEKNAEIEALRLLLK